MNVANSFIAWRTLMVVSAVIAASAAALLPILFLVMSILNRHP
jgi:hypothetical protein